MTNLNNILNDLSVRVKSGIPDLTNEQHLIKLFDVLKEHKWPINARVELLQNLTEAGKKHYWPQTKLPYIEGIGYKSKEEAIKTLELVDNRSDKKDIIETLMNRAEFHNKQTQGMRDAHAVFKSYLAPQLKEAKGDTSSTTFYHEVMTGILVGGGNSSFKDGEEVGKFFKNGTIKAVNASLGTEPPKGQKWERFLQKDSIPKPALVSDAKNLSTRIKKELGKGKNMMWTGPTNDGSKFGAADIAGKFSGYGEVGISLKAGVGQLKNLTLGTFTKILGLKELKGAEFLKKYNKNFNSMTKDWMKLIDGLFGRLTKDSDAKKIFKRHSKSTWDAYQKEILTEEELDILTDAVGLPKMKYAAKTKKFKYFCRKIQEKNHPQWKEWQVKRGKHFNDIFSEMFAKEENNIRQNLSTLFKRQLSVGKTSLFYAAKGGKTFWFIPSEKLYDKEMGPDKFIADYELQESQAGYKFLLDVGTQELGGIGTIIVEIRFAKGQMDGAPDVKSSYKLMTSDWSGLLGAFRK